LPEYKALKDRGLELADAIKKQYCHFLKKYSGGIFDESDTSCQTGSAIK